jgi:hypothetical protein
VEVSHVVGSSSQRYLVELGTGPAATVYGGRSVALKVYPSIVDEEVLGGFEREQARLAPARARSPILPVDELVELPDGRHALRMRLCETSVAELVAGSGPLEVADALAVGHDVRRGRRGGERADESACRPPEPRYACRD